jgi:hypothetical protein
LSNPGTLQRVVVSFKDNHVIPNPFLHKDRKKCCRKAEGECHEPESVHKEIRFRWVESRVRGWRGGRDGELWGYEGDLLRDLGEHLDVLLQVVYCLICGVRLQALFAVDDKRSDDSRE